MTETKPSKRMGAPNEAGWNAASTGIRKILGFNPANVEATTLIVRDQAKMAARAKKLALDNPYIAGYMRDIKAQVIGTGIPPHSLHPDEEWRKVINEVWHQSQKQMDADGQQTLYGMQTVWAGAIKMSGEIFLRKRYRRPGDRDRNGKKLIVPFQIQTLESDFCPVSWNRAEETGYTRAGIKFGKFGQVEGYWLYPIHPGSDATNLNLVDRQPKLIPTDQIIHALEVMGPSQLRGYSGLAAALLPLNDIQEANEAALQRQKVCNLLSVFLKQVGVVANADSDPLGGVNQNNGTSHAGLMPGAVNILDPGYDPVIMDPKESGVNHGEMIKVMLHAAAKAIGIPYDMLSGDLSDVNMSATRHGREILNAIIDQMREFVMVDQILDPLYSTWIEQAVLSGAFDKYKKNALSEYLADPDKFAAVEWAQKAHAYIDPEVDIKAAKIAVRSGFTSRSAVIQAQGGYVEDVDAQQKRDMESEKAIGARYDSNGNNVDMGSTQGPNPGSGRAAESQLAGTAAKDKSGKEVVN